MQKSARLSGRGRSDREHGRFGPICQRLEPLFDSGITRSRRPSKRVDASGASRHFDPLSGTGQNSGTHSDLLHENIHSNRFSRYCVAAATPFMEQRASSELDSFFVIQEVKALKRRPRIVITWPVE